jgi:hypothetical protein
VSKHCFIRSSPLRRKGVPGSADEARATFALGLAEKLDDDAIAAVGRLGLIDHCHPSLAGCALQRGPAFSLPGTGQFD